jgi:hypothetical protein
MTQIRNLKWFKSIAAVLIFLFIFQADLIYSYNKKLQMENQEYEMAKEEYKNRDYKMAEKRLERLIILLDERNEDEKRLLKKVQSLLKRVRQKLKKPYSPPPPPKNPRIITKPGPSPLTMKKKKKFPVLLVIGGVVIAAGVVLLLRNKKKEEQPPPAPQVGSISVETIPDGADIWLDGQDTGLKSNANLDNLSPGTHTVRLIKQGYFTHEESVTVIAGDRVTHRVTLQIHDTPPTVRITYPQNGAEVKGEVLIRVSATDEIGIEKVEFLIDEQAKYTDRSAPYRYEWNTRVCSNGRHTIEVLARDTSGKQTEVEISVKVDN